MFHFGRPKKRDGSKPDPTFFLHMGRYVPEDVIPITEQMEIGGSHGTGEIQWSTNVPKKQGGSKPPKALKTSKNEAKKPKKAGKTSGRIKSAKCTASAKADQVIKQRNATEGFTPPDAIEEMDWS